MKHVKGHISVMILILLREKWELLQLVFFHACFMWSSVLLFIETQQSP